MPQPSSRLRDARKAAGLSQQALADRLRVAQQHIARWETGAVEPKIGMALRLASALGTTAEVLWAPEPPSPLAAKPLTGPQRESELIRRRREWNGRRTASERSDLPAPEPEPKESGVAPLTRPTP